MRILAIFILLFALQASDCGDSPSTENPHPTADVKPPTPAPQQTLLVNGDDAVIETRQADNTTSYEPVEVDR